MVLYGVWMVLACDHIVVVDIWHDLWIDFLRSALILILHDGYG